MKDNSLRKYGIRIDWRITMRTGLVLLLMITLTNLGILATITPIVVATCVPGTLGCGWHDGDVTTYSQDHWGGNPTLGAAKLLLDKYTTVYPSGLVEVGISGPAGFSILFTNVLDLLTYLPASGPIKSLDADLVDPSTSASGEFGGEVLALRFNIDFSDAGITTGTSGVRFGDLSLCNINTLPSLNGITVRQFLDIDNTLLGGGSSTYSIADFDPETTGLNVAFIGGAATKFAQDHLVNGPCGPSGSISGTKFNDLNGNMTKDAGEPGLVNWNITLTNDTGVVTTTTTAFDGSYNFTNLTDGNYTVGEVNQPDWIQTAPHNPSTIKLQISGGTMTNVDFGNFKLGEVDGQKFQDLNANGIKDPGEVGLAGWNITINGTDTITNSPVSLTTTTDKNGNYSFAGLTAGTYTVTEALKDGWVQTAPSKITYTVTISSGAVITGQDFGNFHEGNITGGGWITITGDQKATFGIVGQYPYSKNMVQGNVEYHDHIANLNIKSIQINTVAPSLDKKTGTITGLAQVNGAGSYPFVVYVEDNAEPGKGIDVFNISLPTYPYSNGAVLGGGNIQIHS